VAQRALTPHDLLCLEELPGAALSPDGRWLAYVRIRARRTATFKKHGFLSGGERCDVWIVDAAGGAPQNLTRGDDDGSGHCAPRADRPGGRRSLEGSGRHDLSRARVRCSRGRRAEDLVDVRRAAPLG